MKHRAAFLLLFFALIATVGCGQETDTAPAEKGELTEASIEECVIDQGETAPAEGGGEVTTLQPGKLIVGSDTAFPPFESIEGGEAVGFDIDLIKEVAERVGDLEVEIQSAAFDTIFTSLAARKFDVVVSAVTIKEDRKQTVDFTDPYFKADQSLTARENEADEIEIDRLSDKTIGVQAGTTGEDCAKNVLAKDGSVKEVRSYETAPDAFTDLAAGRIDAVLVDLPTAQQIAEERTGTRVVQVIRTQEEYGIAVGKHNPALRVAINEALKGIRDDGTYRELFVKWFKTEPPE